MYNICSTLTNSFLFSLPRKDPVFSLLKVTRIVLRFLELWVEICRILVLVRFDTQGKE